jgi:hypothetical protein
VVDPRAERINEAVRGCLARCYVSSSPLACLAEYVTQLRSDSTWEDSDVLEVEVAVQRVLKRMTQDDPEI